MSPKYHELQNMINRMSDFIDAESNTEALFLISKFEHEVLKQQRLLERQNQILEDLYDTVKNYVVVQNHRQIA